MAMQEKITVACVWVAAIITATDEGLKHAPTLRAAMPGFLVSELWGFAPFLILCIGAIAWLIGLVRHQASSARSPDLTTLPDELKIKITSPRDLHFLEDKRPLGKIFSYEVRGTLKQRPPDHEIWLLTEHHLGGVFPQGFPGGRVQHDSQTGEWVGRVAVTTDQVKIIAVVAPPTSQDFFKYYQSLGPKLVYNYEKLIRVPPECKNMDSVQAYCRLVD